MGIVLGIVADVVATVVASAAEAAATAAAEALAVAGEATAEAAATAVEAASEGAAEAAVEAGTESTAEAAAEAVIEGGAGAAETVAQVLRWVAYLSKIIKEFCAIDAIFKAAKEILKAFMYDPAAKEKMAKLEKSLHLFSKLTSKMEEVGKWLKEHQEDTVKLEGYEIPLESGILSKFMKPLSTAVATLQRLSGDVSNLNVKKQMITDAHLTSLHRGVIRVVATFESLAKYREEKSGRLPVLMSLPITVREVKEWRDELGCEEDDVLSLLALFRY